MEQVEKSGDGPARIKVKRGEETWEVTEDALGDLPDDVRPLVENMLNGSGARVKGLVAPDSARRFPQRRRSATTPERQLDRRFDGLELQLQELQDAIRRIEQEKN